LTLLLAALGCAEPTTGKLSGTITVDGQPAKMGSIAFMPADGKGRTAGGEIVDGKYAAVVSLGEMKVEIRVPKVVGEKKPMTRPTSVKSLGGVAPRGSTTKQSDTVVRARNQGLSTVNQVARRCVVRDLPWPVVPLALARPRRGRASTSAR
jgi:hypothetical protein